MYSLHVLLKFMLGLHVMYGMCWTLGLPSIQYELNFVQQRLNDGSGMSGRSCGRILSLFDPISQRWTEVGWPDWRKAFPGLSPAKRCRERSPANQRLVNMVVNLSESRILPRAAGWSWWHGLALNLSKGIFSLGYVL